ncbi:MAG: glycosyltransferase [Sphingobium sp.]
MKILQLTNYPINSPSHGGQIRCAMIAKALRDAGHEVKTVAVYVEQDYQPASEDDVPFGRSSEYWREEYTFLSDYLSGVHAATDASALAALMAVRDKYRPDIIISEQPWLFAAAEKLAEHHDIRLVHSSQNIEFRLKESMLARASGPASEHAALSAGIKAVEHHAAVRADLLVACTETDAAYFRNEVEGVRKVVVAGNGVEPFSCTKSRVEGWRRYMGRPFAAFVSSGHRPNADGFWDMLTPGLSFLAPDEKILVIGSVGHILMQMKGARAFERVNASRIELIKWMEKVDLQAAVSASHVVLLPISEGEGSNLKTAEALEAGRPIVATSKAFRGFERAASLPHVHITDDPHVFRRTVRMLLDAPRYEGGTPLDVRSRFYWERQIGAMVSAINGLSSRRKPQHRTVAGFD